MHEVDRQPPDRSKPVLLVVDDRWAARDAIESAASEEYRVETAGDGPSALESAACVPPDVALVDVLMPGMTGIDLIPLLLKVSPGTAVIATSGILADPETAEAAIRAGAVIFVEKDFDAEGLLKLLRETLQTRRLASRGLGGGKTPMLSRLPSYKPSRSPARPLSPLAGPIGFLRLEGESFDSLRSLMTGSPVEPNCSTVNEERFGAPLPPPDVFGGDPRFLDYVRIPCENATETSGFWRRSSSAAPARAAGDSAPMSWRRSRRTAGPAM